MHRTETHLCEISHCGKPQEFVTICHSHVKEAEDAINQFSPEELLRLYAIARGEEQTAEKIARKTMNQATAEDVLDLATYDLAQNITKHWPDLIPFMAAHPDGASLYWKILAGCEIAQTKINGAPEHKKEDLEYARKKVRYPMKAGELIEHMQEQYNLEITHAQLRKWTQRGKIEPIRIEGSNHHYYTPKQVLEAT